MTIRVLLLPSQLDPTRTQAVALPEGMDPESGYRTLTELIARVESQKSDYGWEDLLPVFEAEGFKALETHEGPVWDLRH